MYKQLIIRARYKEERVVIGGLGDGIAFTIMDSAKLIIDMVSMVAILNPSSKVIPITVFSRWLLIKKFVYGFEHELGGGARRYASHSGSHAGDSY